MAAGPLSEPGLQAPGFVGFCDARKSSVMLPHFRVVTSVGFSKGRGATLRRACPSFMKRFQIGPLFDELKVPGAIGVSSAFPTQTPRARSRV